MDAQGIHKILRALADATIAEHSQRFFKTGKEEYGEGDKFLGIRVPILRQQVKKYRNIAVEDVLSLLRSSFHEERLFALLLLVEKFTKGSAEERTAIYGLYWDNRKYI